MKLVEASASQRGGAVLPIFDVAMAHLVAGCQSCEPQLVQVRLIHSNVVLVLVVLLSSIAVVAPVQVEYPYHIFLSAFSPS